MPTKAKTTGNKIWEIIDSPKLPLVTIVGAAIFVNTQLAAMRQELTTHFADRVSGSMVIALQDALGAKNPSMEFLSASEIRKIQSEHPPYMRYTVP